MKLCVKVIYEPWALTWLVKWTSKFGVNLLNEPWNLKSTSLSSNNLKWFANKKSFISPKLEIFFDKFPPINLMSGKAASWHASIAGKKEFISLPLHANIFFLLTWGRYVKLFIKFPLPQFWTCGLGLIKLGYFLHA